MVVDGGISAEGIKLALDLESIPEDERTTLTLKITSYIVTAQNVARRDRDQ